MLRIILLLFLTFSSVHFVYAAGACWGNYNTPYDACAGLAGATRTAWISGSTYKCYSGSTFVGDLICTNGFSETSSSGVCNSNPLKQWDSAHSACIDKPTVTCPDGSTAPTLAQCPAPPILGDCTVSANSTHSSSAQLACNTIGSGVCTTVQSNGTSATGALLFNCNNSTTGAFCSTGACYQPQSVTCPDGSTQTALTPCPVVCNSTPSVTTVGTTQTVSWGILQDVGGSSNPICVNNSFNCTAPLVANVEMKRCDLTCDDGSVVNISGGAQCPPPVCKGEQFVNSNNKCEDPDCSATGRYLNPTTHTCLTEPTCVGDQTLNKLNIPHVCDEPHCTGIDVLNVTIHKCEASRKAECKGAQIYIDATNSCKDPNCDPGYHLNAGKICENDGECPLFTTKTMVDGVLKCVTVSTGTSSTTTGQGSVITTTTRNNPDGTTTTDTQEDGVTTSTTQNPDGSITTTTTRAGKTSTTDCPDCAKESTLREVVKKLDATKGGSTAGQGADGLWYEPTDKTYQSILQTGMTGIQNTPIMSFGKDLFNITLPTGSCPTWTVPAVMGMSSFDIAPLCSDAMDMAWPIVAGALKILAVFLAFRIAMSGLN